VSRAVAGEQPLDPVAVLGALPLQRDQLARELAAILVGDGGHVDDTPERPLAAVPADQHREELGDVQSVTLGAPEAAVDLDAGGVDDEVMDALRGQVAMEPEAVTSRLVATEDGGVLRQFEPLLGPLDLGSQDLQATCRDGAESEVSGPCQW
jgi:hypothetical protein